MSWFARLAVSAAVLYLIVLGLAMHSVRYDLWGALVLVPVLGLISIPLVRSAFSGELEPLRPWAWAGMFAKFGGAIAGYQVRFDAYGGGGDANRYNSAGKILAGDVRDGASSVFSVIPVSQGTRFIEELTGLVYTVFGSSRLGGFMVFAWMSYWGLVFFLKAAVLAVPRLATRRYALLLFFLPSLVYWGSSIGKEAFVGLCVGAAAYGVAVLLTRDARWRSGFLLALLGLYGAARVRPHYAAIWVGAALIAILARLAIDIVRRSRIRNERQSAIAPLALAAIALIGFGAVASATLDYLAPPDRDDLAADVEDRFSSIFDETERRTSQGGSSFTPAPNRSPQDWPYAAYRTLTRPIVIEARSLAELLPALEMTALLAAAMFSWRRLANAPRLLMRTPYLLFALLCVATFGVAFASIGNLGILVRQRSLILPLMLLFWCLPPLPRAGRRRAEPRVEPRRLDVAALP